MGEGAAQTIGAMSAFAHLLRFVPRFSKPRLLPALIALIFACAHSPAADTQPATNSPAQSMMHTFLKEEARRLDAAFLDGITNRAQWEARRPKLHQEYLEMLGLWPLPERTPLQAQVTGVLQRDEGFRVEKLHFQSRPRLYVTGNLYLPKDAAPGAKLPAVLYVCGHSGRGRDGNKTAYQHHGAWFATHGYACLMIDTLQLGEIAAIHHGTYREGRWWWPARGYTPAGVECWNGIRALDYLQSRPEVDPDRLAVTGISGGGAATFWIAAADERVKVAVPVSGMSDLEDYAGGKVVNGHCDCMFLINTFQWPWTHIAALVAPRPMLFENSGHDTIFPMTGNDRIRARLERLYGFYTNRTEQLFDLGLTPGGHNDNPELRLMAYRWLNRHLKGDNSPVTEPDLPKIDGQILRAFPGELPADELNTKIDEYFVPPATNTPPQSIVELNSLRTKKLAELHRIVLRGITNYYATSKQLRSDMLRGVIPSTRLRNIIDNRGADVIRTDNGIAIPWKHFPGKGTNFWLVVLDENESLDTKPDWVTNAAGDAPVILLAPRGNGPLRWSDPAPYYIRRSLPLLGRTVDSCRLLDTFVAAHDFADALSAPCLTLAGRGSAGVIAAYAALLDPRVGGVVLVDPPASHRDGPIFLNVLRVLDVPEALGLLAPRPLTIYTAQPATFDTTAAYYRAGAAVFKRAPLP
jgi:dienelactone hydrolase